MLKIVALEQKQELDVKKLLWKISVLRGVHSINRKDRAVYQVYQNAKGSNILITTKRRRYDRQSNGLQRCLHPGSQNLQICYVTWQRGIKIADGKKKSDESKIARLSWII